MSKKVEDVEIALAELSEKLPHECIQKLKISERFRIKEDYEAQSFPNAENAGVYFFTDADGHVLYVGKSSGLGRRIGTEYIGKEGTLKGTKIAGAITLYTIPMEKDFGFMAPAIEEYLIEKIDPPNNKVGRKT